MPDAIASMWTKFGPALLAGMLSGGIAYGTIQADIRGMERRIVVVETYVDQDRATGAALSRDVAALAAEVRAELRATRASVDRLLAVQTQQGR